jgi:tRNA-splicing ligase RtcB
MKVNETELVVNASLLEDGLVDDVISMIKDNPRLFDGEKVVLMPDAHKGKDVPVGFTMTLSKGLVPVDYVSSDMFCGVSSALILDYVPSTYDLHKLNSLARDIISVNRRVQNDYSLTDLGTLGNGNHFVEVGTNGKDTLISVHSGSRGYGGEIFKKHKNLATQHTKKHYENERNVVLKNIEPKQRESYLKSLPKPSGLPLLDVSQYPHYYSDLDKVSSYARSNRMFILNVVKNVLLDGKIPEYRVVHSVHNYIDNSGDVPILRKGSIQAKSGEMVIIPVNMKDGILLGACSLTDEVNYSLPHGAGRVLSRTRAFNELSLEQFKEDMKDVVSSTVNELTLDESPRAYKPIEVVLKDVEPYLSSYEVFKPIFNYKGV